MKKTLFLTLILVTTILNTRLAQAVDNNFMISRGNLAVESKTPDNIQNNDFNTVIFNYQDDGGQILLPSELKLTLADFNTSELSQDYNILDFTTYTELLIEQPGQHNLGLGFKAVTLNETDKADDYTAERKAYAIPITLKTTQEVTPTVDFIGGVSFFPWGRSSLTSSNDFNFEGDFSGYEVDLAVKANLTDTFALKGGYQQKSYTFGDPEEEFAELSNDFSGIYLGGEIAF
ncbi:hypothetical protein MWH28_11810 [Natroniella sulfidigena]|uniref:hypothetical protein n=1 Tax=Natroniella sulfidigena TaxID=723921 RepID=UPI00200B8ED7|nr:hypothetical protein [Natroniella sulfidigena]MCK8818043.1 hypothetical protein [Natroniella sulfidigena]